MGVLKAYKMLQYEEDEEYECESYAKWKNSAYRIGESMIEEIDQDWTRFLSLFIVKRAECLEKKGVACRLFAIIKDRKEYVQVKFNLILE